MPSISFTLSLRGNLLSSVVGPESLFYAGEVGQLMPVDPAYLYQDTAGTTPVTATGQSVALQLDQSKGLVLGSELVTNGNNEDAVATAPLDTLTNFTTKIRSTDRAQAGTYSTKLTANSTSGAHYWNLCNVAAGETLKITGWIYVPTDATAGQSIKMLDIVDGSYMPTIISVSPSTYDKWVYFSTIRPAKATAWFLSLGQDTPANWAGGSIYIDNLSIQTLAGNHDTQPTIGSRPIYGKHPANGYRNMLINTPFSGAVSGSPGTIPTSWTLDINNATITAAGNETFTVSGTAQRTVIRQSSATISAGGQLTWSAQVTVSSGTLVFNQIFDFTVVAGPTYSYFLDGNAVTSTTTIPIGTRTLRVSVTNDATARTFGARLGLGVISNSTGSVSFFKPQLEPGSTATTYQRTGATSGVAWPAPPSYDITEAGQPDLHYLHYNGVSSFMVSPTITPGIDKAQVFVGMRKLSDAAAGIVVEYSTTTLNSGSFGLQAPNSATNNYRAESHGTSAFTPTVDVTGFPAPVTNVLAMQADIAGDLLSVRVNGVQQGQSTADQGTGNFLAYPIYTGRRAGTSLPFNGLVYSKIVRFGPNLTADQIASTERWTAQRTGVSL